MFRLMILLRIRRNQVSEIGDYVFGALGSFTDCQRWFCHYFTAVWFPQINQKSPRQPFCGGQGRHDKPNGYPHKVTAAHQSDGFWLFFPSHNNEKPLMQGSGAGNLMATLVSAVTR